MDLVLTCKVTVDPFNSTVTVAEKNTIRTELPVHMSGPSVHLVTDPSFPWGPGCEGQIFLLRMESTLVL